VRGAQGSGGRGVRRIEAKGYEDVGRTTNPDR
jgi:hypothetical protein